MKLNLDVKGLADSIVETVRARAGKFLDDHQDAKDFILERAKRVAALVGDYALAEDADRPGIREQLEVVRQSVENELSSVAVDAAIESRLTFSSIVNSVLGFAAKALPSILGAL
jgi:hypothetical protein